MRVALLAASGLLAASLEELTDAHPEAEIRLVWTVLEPGSVLAALDHDPDAYLLDMRWRERALAAGALLQAVGVPIVIALFSRLDDTLIPDARQMGLEVYCLPTLSAALLDWMRATS
jgi:DNA-binding LytR/AlgR family response regulator